MKERAFTDPLHASVRHKMKAYLGNTEEDESKSDIEKSGMCEVLLELFTSTPL